MAHQKQKRKQTPIVEFTDEEATFESDNVVSKLSDLRGKSERSSDYNKAEDENVFIAPFSGDSYKHSIRMAHDWMNMVNKNKTNTYTVSLLEYYKQIMGKKAILVSYKRTKREVA